MAKPSVTKTKSTRPGPSNQTTTESVKNQKVKVSTERTETGIPSEPQNPVSNPER